MEFIVVFGGESWEHEISIVSAITLKKELKNIAHFIFIDAENDLYLIPRESMKSTHFSSLDYKKDAKVAFTKGGFLQRGFLKKQILCGVVINLIHGKSGEDGQIAGILDFYQIPFIGPRIEACAVSFSKELTKSYAKACGVRVLEYMVVDSSALNSSLGASFALGGNFGEQQTQKSSFIPKISSKYKTSTAIRRICERSEATNTRICDFKNADSAESKNLVKNNPREAQPLALSGVGEGVVREGEGSDFAIQAPTPSLKKNARGEKWDSNADLSAQVRVEIDSGESPQNKFKFPCIIKPAHLGSSIGIAVAKESDDLPYALDCAFEYDSSVIVEPFIPHIREFNLAGCKVNGEFIFSIIEEVKKDEFFAFEDKYLDFQGGEKKKSADLSDEIITKIQENFKAIYENCFEGALIRCDFFLQSVNGVDEIYLNEINPIPGSLAHYLFDDFNAVLQNLAQNLPQKRKIQVKYQYISKIQAQKGK